QEMFPDLEDKIKTLSEWALDLDAVSAVDIMDPFAQPETVYRETRDQLRKLIVSLWQKINLPLSD
ncbi:MAG: hypothetical protein PHR37_07830, partial [Eubacteriales bacterium]|nr:hypothetical protein [Eubacteriales bacterium]